MKFIDTRQKTPLLVAGMNAASKPLNAVQTTPLYVQLGRLARSREREALSRVKLQEHELKQLYVGTNCVEFTPVDIKILMVEAGSPVS